MRFDAKQDVDFQVAVVVLSDRASAGVYDDLSGKIAIDMIKAFFKEQQKTIHIHYHLIPDDADALTTLLQTHIGNGTEFVFTSGSTGIGPRDIAPEAIKPLLDKEIPGVMEYIRLKYGAIMPPALLSRSIAGVARSTLIYALPGRPKAVEEYLVEIFKTILHCRLMVKGWDGH